MVFKNTSISATTPHMLEIVSSSRVTRSLGSRGGTNGGIRGEVTALDERDVTIEIADRMRIKVLKSHIAGLDQSPQEKS